MGHSWKKVTRRDKWSRFKCRNCGHLVTINTKDSERVPDSSDLEPYWRKLTCDEMIVRRVHNS